MPSLLDLQTIFRSEYHLLGPNDSIIGNLQGMVSFLYPGHERVNTCANAHCHSFTGVDFYSDRTDSQTHSQTHTQIDIFSFIYVKLLYFCN